MSPAVRRRRLALAAMAVLALVVGVIAGAGGDGDEPGHPTATTGGDPAVPAAAIPLAKAVGQVVMVAFDGTEPPQWVRRWLRNDEAAGVILFGGNVTDAAGTRGLTGKLQRAARNGALVATDQEGGEIRILKFAPPETPQPGLATPAAARTAAGSAGRALKAMGVNINLAPVADVTEPGSALAGRGYPGDPGAVGGSVAAAVGAYDRSGVAATAKHFPGLGRASENTDDAGVDIDAPRAQIEGVDLPPFEAAIRARVPLIMASHAAYTSYDDRIASQSPVLMQAVLREELGFQGVAVTDSIEAQAVLARSAVGPAAERSIAAGCDIVLMTGSGSWSEVYPRLLRRARRDRVFAARVRESAARVMALKRKLGLRVPG